VKTECACRGRIEPASTLPRRGNWSNQRHLCGRQTDPRGHPCDNRSTASAPRDNPRFSAWSPAPADDGSPRRLHHGAPLTEETPFSNGQTGLTPSRLPSCGRLRIRPSCRPRASPSSARGIVLCVDPDDMLCRCGPRNGISRVLPNQREPACGNPRREPPRARR